MENRLIALACICILAFTLVTASLALVSSNQDYALAAARQSGVSVVLSEGRGNIFDCNFSRLTGTAMRQYAFIEPGRTSYHTLFEAIPASLRASFYESIQRGMPFLMPVTGQAASRAQYLFYAPERYQPIPIAQHLIGYLDDTGHGVSGVEYACDDLLSGGFTQKQIVCSMNARGSWIESDAPHVTERFGTGAGVMLTIDSRIQRTCEAIGTERMDKGCILVLETATGRVRASVSLPLYDPENVAASITRQDTSLVNRAVNAYSVGSVFKPLLAAAALEQGISAEETYECAGAIEVGGHIYRCAYGRGHGTVDMRTALLQSCNCYFIWLGLRLGAQTVHDTAQNAGFGQSQRVVAGMRTVSGNLPTAEQLADRGQLATISFGQGALTATPVQVAAMMNLFAGDGGYLEPSFVEGIVNEYEQTIAESLYRPVQRQVFSPQTAHTVRQMLVGVVEEGLGRRAAPRAGGAGGKTGTAQTGRRDEADEEIMDAWFAGFYPAAEPVYTIVVLLDSGSHDSDDAAEIFAQVADSLSFFLEQM